MSMQAALHPVALMSEASPATRRHGRGLEIFRRDGHDGVSAASHQEPQVAAAFPSADESRTTGDHASPERRKMVQPGAMKKMRGCLNGLF